MLNLIVKFKVTVDTAEMNTQGFFVGTIVETYWDDTNSKYVVKKYSSSSDTEPDTITSGPRLWALSRTDGWQIITPIAYTFCSGTALQSFEFSKDFPYVKKISTPNHFQCVDSVVCDLSFQPLITIVKKATNLIDPDGLILVAATSSNGEIKYSLKPTFNYETEGQTTGRFANLYPGTYTITAKDENGCTDQITLTVELDESYGVLYRLDYNDLNGIPTRVDVLERGFSGSITEVKGSDVPVILKWDGDGTLDKFKSIITSKLELTLMAESNFQFIDIFSQDERKYKINYYKDWGNIGPEIPGGTEAVTLGGRWYSRSSSSLLEDWSINQFNGDKSITSDANGSEILYTSYSFVAGREYEITINYTFSGIATALIAGLWKVRLGIFNDSFTAKFSQTQAFGTTSGTGSITLSFTATEDCTKIGFNIQSLRGYNATVSVEVDSVSGTEELPATPPAPLGYELKWTGYVLSSSYAEPYIKDPYPVTLVAIDGLGDLKNFDFTDNDGNLITGEISAFECIRTILSKTDLDLNIISSVNKYEDEMNSDASDDPLTQVTFNPETFIDNGEPKDCATVLSEILKSFGARLLQRDGKWFMYLIEQSVSTMEYREFTSEGAYVGSGTIDDRVDIKQPSQSNRVCFVYVSQNMEVIPAYGTFYLDHTLIKNESLIRGHSFEEKDLTIYPDGRKVFKHWTFNNANSPGSDIGIKEFKDFDGSTCFYVKYDDTGEPSDKFGKGKVRLSSKSFSIEYDNGDLLELSFSLAAIISKHASGYPWTKLQWTLKIGDYYYNENLGEWTDETSELYTNNDLIVERYNEAINKKITIPMRNVPERTTETGFFRIIFTNTYTYDYSSISALKDVATEDLFEGTRKKVLDTDKILFYKLTNGNAVESSPDIILPDDYQSVTNDVYWELEDSKYGRQRDGRIWGSRPGYSITYFYFDNAVLLHYPGGATPPASYSVERLNSKGIKVDFEETYLLNDIDTTNINNSERTYKNFYKRLDGTPTESWTRTYRVGSGKLLDILSEEILTQYKKASRKLTGSFAFDREVRPSSVCTETTQGLKKYMFMTYELNDKDCVITFDMAEIKNYANDDDIDAGFTKGFSLGFRS